MQHQTLCPLPDLPPVVQNSLLHSIGAVHQDIIVAYHVAETFADSKVRVLNMSNADCQCAAVRFFLASAIHVDYWNGDDEQGHPLCELGIRRNGFFEVLNSRWAQGLRNFYLGGGGQLEVRHYAMAFRTRIVQIAAHSYQVSVARQSLSAALL